MTIKLGVVMDPIANIHYKKDSTLAMLWEAQRRGWLIHYMEQKDLFSRNGEVLARMQRLTVHEDPQHWFILKDEHIAPLAEFDVILMRKDPPFDVEYIFTTYLLEAAEAEGTLVINKPQSLRDANEKLFISWFPQCCPPALVTRDFKLIHEFLFEYKEIVLKPLGGMGGASVFRMRLHDDNVNVIIETLTAYGTRFCMAQQFIPEVISGDKRILMIDGEPVPYALARIPAADDFRGNLASGAKGEGRPLTERDLWICQQVGPKLKEKGLIFVGLDVIGDYLTEINVTSPTCIRELDAIFDINISRQLFDCIEKKIKK